jgi:monoterpene epsilon-lactone hydrolase
MWSGVSLTAGQKATISPQAVEYLLKIPQIPFSDYLATFLTSPSRIPGIRAQFEKKQKPIEESIITKYSLELKHVTVAGIPVVLIEPPVIEPENEKKIILNIHGGAFVLGSARDRTGLLMAAEMGIRVYSIEYSLSPEARYPVARDQCLAVYRQLIEDKACDPKKIIGMSSSSGCQLMLSMLLLAQREKLPMPACLFLCALASDLTGDGDSFVANSRRNMMPASFLLGMVRQNYRGGNVDLRDPLYSPIYAEYNATFPPSIITVGTRDSLLSSGVCLYWKLRDADVKVELLVSEGMWHGFNWEEEMPEAIRVRAAVRTFLQSLA